MENMQYCVRACAKVNCRDSAVGCELCLGVCYPRVKRRQHTNFGGATPGKAAERDEGQPRGTGARAAVPKLGQAWCKSQKDRTEQGRLPKCDKQNWERPEEETED